jgi:hypothetical protein
VGDDLVSLGWSDEALPVHRYVCFYYADERTMHRSLSFIRVGLAIPGDFCMILADSRWHPALLDLLREGYAGDIDEHLGTGKLELADGAPTTNELTAAVGASFDRALASGLRRIRALGFLAWGRPGWPDVMALRQFEAAVNELVVRYPAVIVCTYWVPDLPGEILRESGLGNHPIVMIDDLMVGDGPFHRAR